MPPTPGRYVISFATSQVNIQTHQTTPVDLARLKMILQRQP